jgi:hypothetical protein
MTKYHNDDENLPNFIKRKHPRKKEKKKQSAKTTIQASKRAQRCKSHEGKGSKRAPKRWATWRKGTIKYRNFHWSHETSQLKKGEVNFIKL